MRLISISGIKKNKNVESKRIKWDEASKSKLQFAVKQALKKRWQKHIVYEEFPVYGTRLSLDFYNATTNVAVEVQGAHHTSYVKGYFHKGRQDYLHQLHKDMTKKRFCEMNGITLVEVMESERKQVSEEFLNELGVFG